MSESARTTPSAAGGWASCELDPVAIREDVRPSAGTKDTADDVEAALIECWAALQLHDDDAATATLAGLRRAAGGAAPSEASALCDEFEAILLFHAGRAGEAAALQQAAGERCTASPAAIHRYIAHGARACVARALGQTDVALRHLHAARRAAADSGGVGPQITAAIELGAFHRALLNLDHARVLCEQALAGAREAGAALPSARAAAQLLRIHHAAAEPDRLQAVAALLQESTGRLPATAAAAFAPALALSRLERGELAEAKALLENSEGADDPETRTLRAWLQVRCRLGSGDAAGARRAAEAALERLADGGQPDESHDRAQLMRAAADACEAGGDMPAALRWMRAALERSEALLRGGARARALIDEVDHQLDLARRERDDALDSRRSAEDDRRRLVELNAALQVRAAETEALHAQLREQALRDPLTGLHNRRYLFEMAPGMLELARRQGRSLCVALIDLDHFKLLNDTYGHHAGDLVLQQFAALLVQSLRRSDVVCRHGGEEFVAVMPDIDGAGAQQKLDGILGLFQEQRSMVGRRRLPGGSFSAGLAQFPRHGATIEQLLSRADRALYAAKNHGRSRIEQAPRTGFGALT